MRTKFAGVFAVAFVLGHGPAHAQSAERAGDTIDTLDLTMTLMSEGATRPEAVTRIIELPAAAAAAAEENAAAGLERANQARGANRASGLDVAAEARENGQAIAQEMREQAQENRENAGRGRPDSASPPEDLPGPPENLPGPPDVPGPPGN
jgi:hypothetical protein